MLQAFKKNFDTNEWDNHKDDSVYRLVAIMEEKLSVEDPVGGIWNIPLKSTPKMWCDASSLAVAFILQVDDVVLEDSVWLKREKNNRYINTLELKAVGKGLSLITE